jgi:hypothetical protein
VIVEIFVTQRQTVNAPPQHALQRMLNLVGIPPIRQSLGQHSSLVPAREHEAASLAGHLRLSNLCWIYDNNHITIEGNTSLAFSEDVAGRFLAYGWNVQRVSNANDLDLLREAFDHFKKTTDRPTLVIVDSHIA